MQLLRILPVLVLLALPAAPLAAQTPLGTPVSEAELGTSAQPPVPQTFDWYVEDGVPSATPWGQPVDTVATRKILSWTTAPEYTSPLVDALPADPSIVSPSDHFGDPVGKPGVLHKVDAIYGYFDALAASTPRVNFHLLGETEEGNHLAVVQVGSAENLARLQEIKAGMNAIADPRGTTDAEAERLIAELPVIYTFYAGLHATETGSPEMVMELAYRLAASESPRIQTIRDNVVVFIVPVAEADGRNRVVDWHRRHNQDVYDPEKRTSPPYWGKYIFHDNNRDGLQLTARLTQILVDHFLEWKYPIGHDLHESIPYLYVSTGTGPYNPMLDPITITEWQWLSNYEVTRLTSYGMPGVWTHGFYSGWYPGYLLWVTNTRNALGRFYETFGNGVPNTMPRELGDRATDTEWYRANPPRDSTLWSLRNNTNYMETGALTALTAAAQNRARILRNYWKKANNSLHKGETQPPFAWVVPADQPRRANAAYMLNLLRRQGIEVHRAAEAEDFGGVAVEEGDYVVRMDQTYRNFIMMLMSVQHFPEDAPRPYDDVAWTFPLMFNVAAEPVDDAAVQDLAMQPVRAEITIPGAVDDDGGEWFAVRPVASAHAIRAWDALRGTPVYAAEDSVGGLPPGTWLVRRDAVGDERMRRLARTFGLDVVTLETDAVDDVARHRMDAPRLAILHSWRYTQDDGWARYTLDQMGLAYDYIAVDVLADTDLRGRYDVILFPSQGGGTSAQEIFQGIDPELGPLAYTETPQYPTHGFPDASPDITGGMSYEGLAALRDFVRDGGTLVTLGSASTLPIGFGLVRGVEIERPDGVFVPGSIVRGTVERPRSPLAYGYAGGMPLYHQFGPYFEVSDELESNVVVRYAAADSLFLSGLVEGAEALAGEPAIAVVPNGEGHVVLFGFDPLHRYQSHADFAFVWNALMHWNDLGVGLDEAEPEREAVAAGGG